MLDALAPVRTGAVTEAARDDAEARPARFHRGDAVGFIDERIVAWGEPAETLELVLGELGREAELVTLIAGDGAPLDSAAVAALAPAGVEVEYSGRPARLLVADRRRVSRRPAGAVASNRGRVRRRRSPSPRHAAHRRGAARRALPAAVAAGGAAGGLARAGREGRRAARAADGRRPARAPAARPLARRARSPSSGTDEVATVAVEVRAIASRPVRRRGMKPLVEATVADQTGIMKVTFFNQPWLERKYRPGTRLMLHGKYQGRNRFRVQFHAETGEAIGAAATSRTYPATDGLSTPRGSPRSCGRTATRSTTSWSRCPPGCGPPALPDRAAALGAAHFGDQEGGRPGSRSRSCCCCRSRCCAGARCGARPHAPRRSPSRRRSPRAGWPSRCRSRRPTTSAARWTRSTRDLAAGRPMQRLLMGEVGSGKTVVALYAMLRAVEHGAQAALMAPTETLAEQHFATLQKLMPGELLQAALLTGSTPARRRADLLGKLASGELKLLVGTHALIEGAVEFDRLAVAVVDEQHRFGVNQRRALDRKAPGDLAPHVLHMTATPIPRTLALTAYGDLDVTVLRELPAGRRPIQTHVASTERERARAYERIREELAAGRQAFVVCPLVEESEALQARAATAEYERLRDGELQRLPRRAPARADEAAREAGGDGGVRGRRRRRARRHHGDRGRDRRPERVGDARRGRRALRDLPAAPAARAGSGAASTSRSASCSARRSRRACARWPSTATASSSPRSTSSCAARGRCSATRQSGLAQFRVARLPEDAELLDGAREIGARAAGGRPRARAARARAARLGGQRAPTAPTRSSRSRPDAGDRGALRRAPAAGAAGHRDAAHVRPRARGAVLDPRRGRWPVRVCSTCSPARARSASRRSRAGAEAVTFVERAPAALRVLRANLDALGADGGDRARRRARNGSVPHPPGRANTIWSSSIPPIGRQRRWEPGSRTAAGGAGAGCAGGRRVRPPRAARADDPDHRRTPLRRHPHPLSWHLIPLDRTSPSAPGPTTRSRTGTST